MKQQIKRLFAMIFSIFLFVSATAHPAAYANPSAIEVTILFTHDLHSHFLPSSAEDGSQYGGYARLMTRIREQKEKYPDALLLDGGDFSMGSLFQTAYTTTATELRIMGKMGYDVTTFGNHEFDYLPKGLASMLNAAASCGERVPAIVDANYLPPEQGEDAELVSSAMENYGVKDYILLERGGVYFAIFGLTGYDSDDCAPNSGMILEEPAVAAQRTVNTAVADCMDTYGTEPIVIALSHSGNDGEKGEDYDLANAVEGIDLIISAHSHTFLQEPIEVNGTYIVSAGEYGKALGVVHLSRYDDGHVALDDYELIWIDESVEEDSQIAETIEQYKKEVEANYLSKYGLSFDEVLLTNDIIFDDVRAVYNYPHESTLGNVFSDAYKWAIEQATAENVDMALTASGVIRESIPLGEVTVSDIFNAASLGVGTEGELLAVYLTGKDLKTALEVDASVYPFMKAAQLFCSGVEYSYNTNRMIFNKVDYAMIRKNDGTLEEIENDRLYRVVCGMYMGQMLGSVEDTSMGLLQITPRDENGNPIATSDLVNYVVHDENGNAIKEWYAIASYLQNMDGKMDTKYASADGRKLVYSTLNPVQLLRNANAFTYVALALLILVIVLITLLVRTILRRRKKH